MTRDEWESCSRWRAVESVDEAGEYLREEEAVEATQASLEGLESARVDARRPGGEVGAFLARRARRLDDLAAGSGRGERAGLLEAVRLPELPGWLVWPGWAGALVAGFALTSLGSERELNLLALPLVGLLLWNAMVMLGAAVWEFRPGGGAGGRRMDWVAGLRRGKEGDAGLAKVKAAFEALTGEGGRRLFARRFRAWLHVAAALVAAGSMAALFTRGWAREYRVVWESTILDVTGAERFFSVLFAPAAAVFGPEVPVAEVAGMRRGEGLATRAADALPWLKLYAGTLGLGVVAPRMALALLTLLRGRGEMRRVLEGQGWGGYALRLLRRVEGSGSEVRVVVAGGAPDDRVRGRWREWLGQIYGGRCGFEMEWVPEGEQEAWVEGWRPEDGRLVAVFFLAVTPEEEVQREWLRRVREAVVAAHYEPEVVVLLDAAGLATRWTAEKRRSREELWREAVSGVAARAWVGDEGGLKDLRSDTPQKPL